MGEIGDKCNSYFYSYSHSHSHSHSHSYSHSYSYSYSFRALHVDHNLQVRVGLGYKDMVAIYQLIQLYQLSQLFSQYCEIIVFQLE